MKPLARGQVAFPPTESWIAGGQGALRWAEKRLAGGLTEVRWAKGAEGWSRGWTEFLRMPRPGRPEETKPIHIKPPTVRAARLKTEFPPVKRMMKVWGISFSQGGNTNENAYPEPYRRFAICCIADFQSARPQKVRSAPEPRRVAECNSALQQIVNLRYEEDGSRDFPSLKRRDDARYGALGEYQVVKGRRAVV
jgi:hypothetical protein